MIWWNLNALSKVDAVDQIIVATDDDHIKEIVLGFGFDKVEIFERSDENASDTASTESVIMEFIKVRDVSDDDTFMLVQATSPFTTTQHFTEALKQFKDESADSLLSVVPTKRFFWNAEGSPLNYDYQKRPRRQDFEGTFMENGAFYINSIYRVKSNQNRLSGKVSLYEMPEYTGVELDAPDDWIIAEAIMRAKGF